jgi:hypothetical protein
VIDLTGDGNEAGAVLVRRVSHAVMNDLAVVRLLLDSANGPAVPPEAAAGLTKAADLIGDTADLLGQLSALCRPGTGVVDADLREVVSRIERLLDVAAGPGASVAADLPDEAVRAAVDPREAQQRLLAQVAALGEVVAPGGTITVGVAGGAITVEAVDVTVQA